MRHKGFSLPYRIFDPDQQRVTHAAITENKRLSEVLAYAKELQDARQPGPVKVGKQRTNYQLKGPAEPPAKTWASKRAERRRAEAAAPTPHAAE